MDTTGRETRRDEWLRLDDAALIKSCREERYRASGPGGQRRNKVETAVRLVHIATGLISQAEESRSLEENRARATRRMRVRIAIEMRRPFNTEARVLPPEFIAYRTKLGGLAVNPRNPAYPLILATVLDSLAVSGGSHAEAARSLGLTTSQLIRFLRDDREIWRALEQQKDANDSRDCVAGPRWRRL